MIRHLPARRPAGLLVALLSALVAHVPQHAPAATTLPFEAARTLLDEASPASLATEAERVWEFPSAPPRPGYVTALRVRARIDTPTEGGDNWFMRVFINGREVQDIDPVGGRTRLLDRPLEVRYKSAKYGPYRWFNTSKWLLHYAPSFDAIASPASPYACPDTADPSEYLLDITDLVKPGGNGVALRNEGKALEAIVGQPLPMVVGALEVGYVPEEALRDRARVSEPLRVTVETPLLSPDVRVSVALLRSRDVPARSKVRVTCLRAEEGTVAAFGEVRDILGRRGGSLSIKGDRLPVGAYRIRAAIIAPDGKEVAAVEQLFEKRPPPPWLGTKSGLSDRVLPPWTPMAAENGAVRCWGREYDFGAGLLPEQITSREASLLAAPIRLVGQAGGTPLRWAKATGPLVAQGESAVGGRRRVDSGGLVADAALHAEYDGMMRVDLTLYPDGTYLDVDSLALEIPVKPEHAQYIHYSNLSWSDSNAQAVGPEGWEWSHAFMPFVWLGDNDRGLAWFAESDEGWVVPQGGPALTVAHTADAVVLRVHLIGQPTRLDGLRPLRYTFGLQATPVKPIPPSERYGHVCHGILYGMESQPAEEGSQEAILDRAKRLGAKTMVYHAWWTDHYGRTETEHPEELRRLVKACHDRGLKLILYIGYGLGNLTEETKLYHDELVVEPIIPWASRDKDPKKAFDAGCTRGPYSDYLIYGVAKLIEEYDIDGVYYDGTTEPFGCMNGRHGCGYVDASGTRHRTYPMWACRDLIKRLYTVFAEGKLDFLIDAHMSANLTIPTLSFCHSYWDGEQFEGLKHGEQATDTILPLDKFRAEFMGRQWGLRSEFLVYEGRPFTMQEALGFTLLHDVLVRPGPGLSYPDLPKVWQVLDGFLDTDWLPYWSNAAVTTAPEAVKCSAYLRPGKQALLVVSNISMGEVDGQVRLSPESLTLTPQRATDALTGEALPLDANGLALHLAPMGWRMIVVE